MTSRYLIAPALALALMLGLAPLPAQAATCGQALSSLAVRIFVADTCQVRKAAAPPRHPFRVQRHQGRRGVSHQPVRFERDVAQASPAGGDRLVEEASRYLGSNPTGWRSRWCGRFLAMVVEHLGGLVPRHPNLAMSWATLPRTSPHVGAIAVLSRRGGGHVGIVAGFDRHGDPILVSGNHGRVVGLGVYSIHRIRAWVSAT